MFSQDLPGTDLEVDEKRGKFLRLDEANAMNCEGARDSIILAAYGELPDEDAVGLEQHLALCSACMEELNAMRALDRAVSLFPMVEPDPNLVAQSRMRLDEALDAMPQHGFLTRLQSSWAIWLGNLQSAPALATLLVGIGFLSGNFTHRYQVAHQPKAQPGPVVLTNTSGGGISTISGITQLPNDMVQVSYNRVVPEVAEGSLDDPQIRHLLMVGAMASSSNVVHMDSVGLLADECRVGHECVVEADGTGIRNALLTSLRTDKSPAVRLKVLEGLQPYVSQDERVRDAVAQALLTDSSAAVRTKAIAMLEPVQSDTSVRQVLRTVSTTDENPYIRTVSSQALLGSASIQ